MKHRVPVLKKIHIKYLQRIASCVFVMTVALFILNLFHERSPPLSSSTLRISSLSLSSLSFNGGEEDEPDVEDDEKCDIFTGEWVPNPEGPYYTNETCLAIHDHQNCMKFGRPDTEFMKWKWKPAGCDLPVFNPSQFLEVMRGKSMAFVGDSVARNQVQSLICLLSRVMYPMDHSTRRDDRFKRLFYPNYNFTLASYWSPHLIRTKEATGPSGRIFNLYLDEVDENWTSEIENFDFVIISAGQWFFGPAIFYENGNIIGCNICNNNNITELTKFYGFRKAFRTSFGILNRSKKFKGTVILRTFSPGHFDGTWNKGGDCKRTKPFKSNEIRLKYHDLEFYLTQMEEFRYAELEGKKKGLKYGLLDTTQASLLRPDGHPSRYGHPATKNVTISDCVHWCLPGPIDAWNDLLLQMLKMESGFRISKKRI